MHRLHPPAPAVSNPSPEELPDAELVRRFVEGGDERAFANLLRRHGAMVLGVCRSIVRDAGAAEDVFQATFLVLARKAPSIHRRGSVGSWLHGVAYRLAHKARARAPREECTGAVERASGQGSALDDLTWREVCGVLHEELAALPEKYRGPLLLCYWEGLTQDEAARQLGLPKGTLKDRLARARERLRARLTRRGCHWSASASTLPLAGHLLTARVPEHLVCSAARSETASPGARLLAEGVLASAGKWKAALISAACVLLAGVGWALRPGPTAAPMATLEGGKSSPAKKGAKEPARPGKDAHGDPLPAGAVARLGTVRFRHDNWVMYTALSPDGKTLAGAGGTGVVLWDLATGKEIRRFQAPEIRGKGVIWTPMLGPVAFSPDGKLLASGNFFLLSERKDAPLFVWDRATGKLLHTFPGHEKGTGAIRFVSRNVLASGGGDGVLRLWDVGDGKLIREVPNHGGSSLAISPDGRLLASSAVSEETGPFVRLYDLAAGRPLRRLRQPKGQPYQVAFSADGKMLATGGSDGRVYLWDVATGEMLRELSGHKDMVLGLAFSPDGKRLASGATDREVRLWDPATGKEVRRITGFMPACTKPLFADGKTLITFGAQNTVRFWDPATGKENNRYPGHASHIEAVAYSPDGRFIATSGGGGDMSIRLWDARTHREVRTLLGHTGNVTCVAFAPDGKVLASGGDDGTVRLWEVATGKPKKVIKAHGRWLRALAFAPDGKRIASGGEDNLVRIWDLATGKKVHELTHLALVTTVAWSPDGTLLASAGYERIDGGTVVRLWDPATGKEVGRLTGLRGAANSVCFSPDGRTLATGGLDHTVRIWDVDSGKELVLVKKSNRKFNASVKAVAFSPDGRLLAWGNREEDSRGKVHVYDQATGKELPPLAGHRGLVTAVAFSPDGKRLVSASNDTTALVWEVSPPTTTGEVTPAEWDDLAGGPEKAYRAVWALVRAGDKGVSFLAGRVKPAKGLSEKEARRAAPLMKDLESDDFAVREKADRELRKLGPRAEVLVREALKGRLSLEVHRRLEAVFAASRRDRVRALRAVGVLEKAGTARATEMLEELARGAAGFTLTDAAGKALARVRRRSPTAE